MVTDKDALEAERTLLDDELVVPDYINGGTKIIRGAYAREYMRSRREISMWGADAVSGADLIEPYLKLHGELPQEQVIADLEKLLPFLEGRTDWARAYQLVEARRALAALPDEAMKH